VLIAERGKRVLEARAFTGPSGKDANDPQPFFDLIPIVGAWMVFALRRAVPYSTTLKLVGTERWESYALFRQGVAFHETKPHRARSSYLHALDLDPKNRGALINLAQLDVRNPKAYGRAIRRFDMARAEINREDARYLKPYWYQITYLTAVTLLHRYTHEKDEPNGKPLESDLKRARLEAASLVRETAATLIDLSDRTKGRRDRLVATLRAEANGKAEEELKLQEQFLRSAEEQGITILISAQAEASKKGLPSGGLDEKIPSELEKRWKSLSTLDVDKPPAAETLIGSLGPDATLSLHSQYNLACYWSRADKYPEALLALEQALELGGSLIRWAEEQDPALHGLRTSKTYGQRFRALIKQARAESEAPVP
jgi:hypothetical protein